MASACGRRPPTASPGSALTSSPMPESITTVLVPSVTTKHPMLTRTRPSTS